MANSLKNENTLIVTIRLENPGHTFAQDSHGTVWHLARGRFREYCDRRGNLVMVNRSEVWAHLLPKDYQRLLSLI